MGMDKTNFYVLFPAMNFIFSLPGIIGASVAFSGLAGKSSASGKVQEVAALSAGPLYISMMFAKLCIAFAQSSLATARRSSGVNVPDQHVYKVVGGPGSTMVLMDEEGAFGTFNRAQRGVQNIFEQLFPLTIETVLAGYVFPWTTACCFGLFAFFRTYGALAYAKDRKARMKGNLPAGFAASSISGLVLVTGIYATYLELKK
eukprot:g26337.t1